MRGEAVRLTKLLEGSKTRFVIPVYQRNYDWKVEQCSRLFDDLEEMVKEDRKSHFFGSIVSVAIDDERLVIDGQQRITTTFLLLQALVRSVEGGACTVRSGRLVERVHDEFLVDRYSEGEDALKVKLKLVKADQAAFAAVIAGDADHLVEGSNVTSNYRYFLRRIAQSSLDADGILEAIEGLEVIDIKLDGNDDAQLIFESLNSTGLDLTEGDKIRNYILMGLPAKLQEEYYSRYWNPIELDTGYDVSTFVRDWLTAKRKSTPAQDRVYSVFREYSKKRQDVEGSRELLEDMLRYARFYKQISEADTGMPKTDRVLRRLNLLEMSVIDPFLLGLLDWREGSGAGDDEVAAILATVETYLFRRWVCGVGTNALNKVFETLNGEAQRGMAEGASYGEVLTYVLLKKEGSGRFPSDKEFVDGLRTKNFYAIQGKKYYLYDRLENGDNRERVDVVGGIQGGSISIEHIMPQTLSGEWREALGPDADEIHEEWVNRLANITITGYNSEYQNFAFRRKRDMKNGYLDSGFRMNSYVKGCESWGVKELREREEQLTDQFLGLWPLPSTDFVPKEDLHEEHSLAEDFDFTNRKIAAYSLIGERRVAKTWVDMVDGVLATAYELDPASMVRYTTEDHFPARYFSPSETDYCFKVGDGLFFNPGSSTETKIEILKSVFERIGIDEDELSFELYRQPVARIDKPEEA
jgi:uncharacterized protein with ParB-like and HNH nuclease domain